MEKTEKEKAPFWFPVAPVMVVLFIYLVLLLSNQILLLFSSVEYFEFPFIPGYFLGVPLILIGLLFFIWGFSQLKPAAAIGFAKRLRNDGAYGLTRNPMYFGVSAMFWGAGLTLGKVSVLIGAFIWSLLNYLSVVLWEEKQMRNKFGEEYSRYKNRVPRFIPVKLKHLLGDGSGIIKR